MAEAKKTKPCVCFALNCNSSRESKPDKYFFPVPKNKERREMWCRRLKREAPPSCARHVCEDHFDLEEDTENLGMVRAMGGRLRLKADVLPHKFTSEDGREYVLDGGPEEPRVQEETPELDPLEIGIIEIPEMEWTNDQVMSLIEEYQRRPLLWDPRDPHHRRNAAKYKAWHELAVQFDCDMAELRKKLTSVFASYRRERARVRQAKHSYWFLYDRLGFMPNHVPNVPATGPRPSRKLYRSSSDESDEVDDAMETEPEVKVEPSDVAVEDEAPRLQRRLVHSKRRLTRGGQDRSPMRVAEITIHPEVRREPAEPEVRREAEVRRDPDVRRDGKDECDSFGEYIAMSLRKHDERTRATMKQAINNIIFELEMKKCQSEPYALASDVNPLNGYGT